MMKRVFDWMAASMGLVVLFPVFLVIAIVIKRDSHGPVLYGGLRLGRHGRPFRMLKFRTMVADADRRGQPATPEGDPRVTRVGKFLRNYKLDELPQLINVVRGEMSLVGPRPEAPLYFDYYTEEEKSAVLSVRPGMTDYGSLQFHDEGRLIVAEDPVQAYIQRVKPAKVKLQMEYIQKRSFLEDVRIILATIRTILGSRFFGSVR